MFYFKKYAISITVTILAVATLFAQTKTEIFERAVTSGTKEELVQTLKKNKNLVDYIQPSSRDTWLHIAVQNDRPIDIIKLLLNAGISPTEKNHEKQTPIMQLCQNSNNAQVLDLLITSGTVFNLGTKKRILLKDKAGKTAIDYALGKTEMITVLQKYAPKEVQAAVDAYEQIKRQIAAEEQAKAEASTVIVDEPAPVKEPDPIVEAEPEQPEKVLSLTTDTASTVAKPTVDITGTVIPVYLFDVPEYEDNSVMLLSSTPMMTYDEANSADKNNVTMLMKAVKKGDLETARKLIAAGAEIEAQDKDGWTALMYAVRFNNDLQMTKLLLAYGANRDTKNKVGATAIKYAAMVTTNPNIIFELVNHRNSEENKEAFIYAITAERPSEIIQAFLDSDIPVNSFYNGKTPLMLAAASNTNTNIIRTLLQNGADAAIKSPEGFTAHDYAQANKNLVHDDIYFMLAK
ncbi:MAG: ankyrin repeat domain-containing protein [Treponema sp.]|nr:ankyrin repeat domain-containing protein [Treponema sp.]